MNQNENKNSTSYNQQEFKFPGISNQTLYCALSYIYFFWLVGLIVDRNNKIIQFHVNQGIILFSVSLASLLIINTLSNVLYSIAPILASLSAFFEVLWILLSFIFMVIGIKNVLNHQQKALPIIGNMFNLFK